MTEIESKKSLLSNFQPLNQIWQFGTTSASALSRFARDPNPENIALVL